MNLNSTQQFQEALQVVISRLNADLREASGKLEHLPACEWQSQHGRALLNREQELHTAWCVLNGMRSTQAEPVAVASPTMEQKIAGAHAADIKPSQAEAVYLAMLAATPAADAQDQKAIAREQEACALACEALVANAADWDSSYWDRACNRCALEVRNRKAQRNPQTKEST